MHVFAIAGCKRSGKDTAADILKNIWEEGSGDKKNRVGKFAFADALRDVCKIVFGYTDEHFLDPLFKETLTSPILGAAWTPRRALQFVGTELFRQQVDPDVWVHVGIERLRAMEQSGLYDVVLVTDCRFENELQALKRNFEHTTTLFVIRPGHLPSRPEHPHESERFVQNTELELMKRFDVGHRHVGLRSGIFDFAIVNFEDELPMFVDALRCTFSNPAVHGTLGLVYVD